MGFTANPPTKPDADQYSRPSFIPYLKKRVHGSFTKHLHTTFCHGFNVLKIGLSSFMAACTLASMTAAIRACPPPALLVCTLLLFAKLEYSVDMVMPGSEPRDVGFQATSWLHHLLANHPFFNSILAACNTGFVIFQVGYVMWAFFIDGRKKPAIASLFMYAFRAFLGYATQLPLPQEFLGSGLDFPVNNTPFFLFFSGHVAGSVIVAMDMRHMGHRRFALGTEVMNLLQSLRLLGTRGHYSIDILIGVGAGWMCDHLATVYEDLQHHSRDGEKEIRNSYQILKGVPPP